MGQNLDITKKKKKKERKKPSSLISNSNNKHLIGWMVKKIPTQFSEIYIWGTKDACKVNFGMDEQTDRGMNE